LEAVLATAGVKVPSPLMSDKAIEALRESDRVRAPVAGDRPLVNGAKGEDIRALQRQMNERGAGIKADGEWGPKSQAAFDKLLGPIASALGFFYPITLQTALYAMKLLSGSSGTTPPPPAPSGGAANEPLSISEPNGYSGWWGDDEEEREKELPPVPENVVNVGAAPGPVPPSKKHSKEPPEVKGLPFAPAGTGLFWPVRTLAKEGREVNMSGRYVGAKRPAKGAPTRHHCAIDLYGNLNDPVVACEDGRIVVFKHFYRGVYCILVQCDSGSVINYGEVDPESLNFAGLPVQQKGTIEVKKEDGSLFKRVPNYVLIPGNDYRVKAGQVIGKIGKMYNDSMLHFEMYQQGTTSTSQWKLSDKSPPKSLLNPGRYLVHLAEHGK
jgi:murein DD-endopeptidase MepM/ murein hydrolase activator NlpD